MADVLQGSRETIDELLVEWPCNLRLVSFGPVTFRGYCAHFDRIVTSVQGDHVVKIPLITSSKELFPGTGSELLLGSDIASRNRGENYLELGNAVNLLQALPLLLDKVQVPNEEERSVGNHGVLWPATSAIVAQGIKQTFAKNEASFT